MSVNFEFVRSEVIGALKPLTLPAHFSDAPVILRHESSLFRVDTFMDEPSELAEGSPITNAEWAHLLRTEEAFELNHPISSPRYARCWVFRGWKSDELDRWLEELRGIGAAFDRQDAQFVVVCLDEMRASKIRERWTRELYDDAWTLASDGKFDEALELAEVVWEMDLYRSQSSTLLYCAVLEKLHRMSEARDLLHLESNSTGKPLSELESILQTYLCKLEESTPRTQKRRRYFTDPGTLSFVVPGP